MKPFTARDLRGVWATLILPIREDDVIDWDALERQLATILTYAVNGIYMNGSTGEFYAQGEPEFQRLSTLLAENCEAAGIPFQIGACDLNPRNQLERARFAAKLKPCAIQIILPDWFVCTLDEAANYLMEAARVADPIGLVLYNPPHAKRIFSPKELGVLGTRVPGLVGVKSGGGDEKWYEECRHHCHEMAIFIPGHRMASGLQQGAHGSYSNIACLHPGGAMRWYSLMRDDPSAALELEARINRFLETHILPFSHAGYSNPALDKLLGAIGDWSDIGMRLRAPYRSIPQKEARRLRPIARELLPELFG